MGQHFFEIIILGFKGSMHENFFVFVLFPEEDKAKLPFWIVKKQYLDLEYLTQVKWIEIDEL